MLARGRSLCAALGGGGLFAHVGARGDTVDAAEGADEPASRGKTHTSGSGFLGEAVLKKERRLAHADA